MLARELQKYAEALSNVEDMVLYEVERSTHLHTIAPQMISGRVQGALLTLLTSLIPARRVLEIGTFTAYGTICLARGLSEDPDSRVITIESNPEYGYLAERHIRLAGVEHLVECLTGDALRILTQLKSAWDLVYIDANKQEYLQYYESVIDQVRTGGLIVTDNVLWGGKVITAPDDVDARILRQYNEMLYQDPRVDVIILPFRDGISIARKL